MDWLKVNKKFMLCYRSFWTAIFNPRLVVSCGQRKMSRWAKKTESVKVFGWTKKKLFFQSRWFRREKTGRTFQHLRYLYSGRHRLFQDWKFYFYYVFFFCVQVVKFPFLFCQSGQVIGGEACKVVPGPFGSNSTRAQWIVVTNVCS